VRRQHVEGPPEGGLHTGTVPGRLIPRGTGRPGAGGAALRPRAKAGQWDRLSRMLPVPAVWRGRRFAGSLRAMRLATVRIVRRRR